MTFYKIKCVSAPNKAEGGMDLDIAEIGCASGPALVVDPCFGPPSLTGTLGSLIGNLESVGVGARSNSLPSGLQSTTLGGMHVASRTH